MLGSVAETVLHRACVPVIVVHGTAPAATFRHILVAHDGTAHSERAFELAVDLATACGASVSVCYVVKLASLAAIVGTPYYAADATMDVLDDQGRDVANYATGLSTDPPFTYDLVLPPGPFGGGGSTTPTPETPYFLLLDGTNRAPYVLAQYMSTGGRELGNAPAAGEGVVCSTLLSFFQGRLASGGGFGSPDTIQTHTYSRDQTTAAGYALYDSVKTDCTTKRENNFFLSSAAFLYCGFRDPCAHAAAQVRNCMAFGGAECADGNPDPFDNAVGDPTFAANSISPDWLAGYVAGQDYNGPHQSVWAKDYGHAVTWSVGGAAYACWD